MTKMKLIFSFLFLISLSSYAQEEYCNGQRKSFGSFSYYPNGKRIEIGGNFYYPNGQIISSSGKYYYLNGKLAFNGEESFYPSGEKVKLGGVLFYPNGQRVSLQGKNFYPNGQLIKSSETQVAVEGEIKDLKFEGKLDLEKRTLVDMTYTWKIDKNTFIKFQVDLFKSETKLQNILYTLHTEIYRTEIEFKTLSSGEARPASITAICPFKS